MKSNFFQINHCIILLLLVAVASIVYWASANILWIGDDFFYQFIFDENNLPTESPNSEPVQTFGDVLFSQYHHYFSINGRVIAHILVQTFCGLLGQQWFAIFNSLAYVLFIAGLVYLVRGNFYNIRTWISATIIVLLAFITKMTPSCQIGYIWMAVLNIVFLYIFLNGEKYKHWQLVLIGVFSILCGNGHEAYSIGFSFGIIVYWAFNIKSFGLTRYVAALCYGAGALLLCLSPAAYSRASTENHLLFQSLFFLIFSLRAVYLLIAVTFYKLISRKITLKGLFKQNLFYWSALVGCLCFNIGVGVFCNRQLFGAELVASILTLKLLKGNTFSPFWLYALGGVTLISVWFNMEKVYLFKKQTERIYEQYMQSSNGNVYQNIWHPGLLYSWSPYFWENGVHTRSLRWLMKREFPDKPYITILPEYLAGKDSVDLGNQIFHCQYKPGKIICIQSKSSPAKFIVERKLFGIVPYQIREMEFERPLYETPYWKAIIYDELNPVILNTNTYIVQQTNQEK